MKHTSAMIYKETDESRELEIYATNTGKLHEMRIVPVIESLKKKARRGLYDSKKAADAFFPIATDAAKMYAKEFASAMDWNQIFDVTARYTCAVEMEQFYREQIQEEA